MAIKIDVQALDNVVLGEAYSAPSFADEAIAETIQVDDDDLAIGEEMEVYPEFMQVSASLT